MHIKKRWKLISKKKANQSLSIALLLLVDCWLKKQQIDDHLNNRVVVCLDVVYGYHVDHQLAF